MSEDGNQGQGGGPPQGGDLGELARSSLATLAPDMTLRQANYLLQNAMPAIRSAADVVGVLGSHIEAMRAWQPQQQQQQPQQPQGGAQRYPAGHQQAGQFAPRGGQWAGAQPQPYPIAPSNTGAPIQQGGGGPSLPSNPHEWPPDVIAKLSPTEARDALRAYRVAQGGFVHPFAGVKRPHEK